MKMIVIVMLGLFLTGCATSMTMYRAAFDPKPEGSQIDIYDTKIPNREYIEFARITNSNGKVEPIIKKARAIGADGIIINVFNKQVGVPVYGGGMVMTTTTGIRAIAIKYKDELSLPALK